MAAKSFTSINSIRTWTRDGFLISTDSSMIPLDALNAAFTSEDVYWAQGLPESAMREMLNNSLCFGLYSPTPSPPPTVPTGDADETPSETQQTPAETLHEIASHVQPARDAPASSSAAGSSSLIGFARCITDRITFLYLTDVYILPAWKSQGLGNWLVACVQEVVQDMPYLRRSMCIIGHDPERMKKFYKRLMGMGELRPPAVALSAKGPASLWDAEGTQL